MLTLKDQFDIYKCDKGSLKHDYARVYEPAMWNYFDEFELLEIGIFKGASIEAIVAHAPKCKIMGIDTFQRVKPEDIGILKHPNVEYLKGDSTTDVIHPNYKFDIIIDDGLHTHDAQRKTFINFFPNLTDDGSYFIEDVWPFDLMSNEEKNHPWLKKHPNDWNDAAYKELLKAIEPYKVFHHDLRKNHDPDTYIIEIRK
ncbi:MAG: hypothetical protein DRQ63_12230 [Gammaproteobacteria bacterium]|nr:MAG: hypothetical protein DRQ63_12230 [Gammaproteobacteria bacterium]